MTGNGSWTECRDAVLRQSHGHFVHPVVAVKHIMAGDPVHVDINETGDDEDELWRRWTIAPIQVGCH